MVGEAMLGDTIVMYTNQNTVWTSRTGVLVAMFVWETVGDWFSSKAKGF